MKQALGPLGEIDIPTSKEMQDAMGHALNPVINALRGEKLMRMPTARVTAGGASPLGLSAIPPGAPIGPAEGYLWRIARLLVASTSITDTAKYTLYEGSDVTDFSPIHVMDFVNPAITQPTPPAITVGASPFTFVNTQPYTVLVAVAGGTVTSITVNGQATGVIAGTFALQTGQFITVTYTAAPAMTESNANANVSAGIPVNVGYNPGSKALWLFPGEQLYAQILSPTFGNQYILKGVIAQVPAEMQGKLI